MPFFEDLALPSTSARLAFFAGCLMAVAGTVWGPAHGRAESVVLAFALAWASAIDVDRFILPNALTLGLLVLGLARAMAAGTTQAASALLGAAIGYTVLAGAAWLYRALRNRRGVGLGDAKLLAAAGAWLGGLALPYVLLFASGAALLWVAGEGVFRKGFDASRPISFGPFISAGFWLVWTFNVPTYLN